MQQITTNHPSRKSFMATKWGGGAGCHTRPSASRSDQSHAWRHYPVSHRQARTCGFLLVPSWFVFGGCLPVLSLLRSDGFVFLPAPVVFRRVTTWGLPADQRGNEPSSFWRFCAYLLRGSFKRHLPGLGCPILATKPFEDVCSDWRRGAPDCPSATWVPTCIVITGHCHWADLGQ